MYTKHLVECPPMLGSNANWLYFSLQLFSSSLPYHFVQFSSVQFSHSVVSHSLWPYIAAHQAFLSITNSQSLLKLTSIKSVMPSNHLILCRPFHLLPSIFVSIKVFSKKSALASGGQSIGFSFSISLSNEYSMLISFRIDVFDLLAVQGSHKTLL